MLLDFAKIEYLRGWFCLHCSSLFEVIFELSDFPLMSRLHGIELVLADTREISNGIIPCEHKALKILPVKCLHILALPIVFLLQCLLDPALSLAADVRYLAEHLLGSCVILPCGIVHSCLIQRNTNDLSIYNFLTGSLE